MRNVEWIDVSNEVDALNSGLKDEVNGVQFTVYASPSHLPHAIRGYHDDTTQHFIIDFSYDDPRSEDLIEGPRDEHVLLRMGKDSGRLYEIEVDVDGLHADALSVVVFAQRALQKVGSRLPARKSTSYRMAADVLEKKKFEVSRQLAGAF